jgi:D-beta-D-heptose 7-phosphate kinase/D-beta-D-heptose 1-phosphate adenosyltransferase
MGDFLVVAVNSDASVRAIKGPSRPIVDEKARAEMVAAFGFVDAVLIFEEETPLQVIRQLVPNVLIKGGDWAEDEIIGADVVRGAGGKVKRIPYVAEFSTSALIQKILAHCGREV